MRRYRVPILVAVIVIAGLLFVGDFLTGRIHREQQDPYSRATRVERVRFGIPSETLLPNAMSDYYYGELRQPRTYHWQAGGDSYTVEKISGSLKHDTAPVPPVMFLDPKTELAFLRALPDNRVRLAVIHSLYQERKPGNDAASSAWNQRLTAVESARVRRIVTWYQLDRQDTAVPFNEWWRDHASLFGLRPDGTPLAAESGHEQTAQARK